MNELERIDKLRMELIEEKEQKQKIAEENAKKKARALGIEYKPETEDDFDSPYTMEDSTATALYIIIMLVGIIFVDRWLIWIMATAIFIGFKTRHKKRNKK